MGTKQNVSWVSVRSQIIFAAEIQDDLQIKQICK